MRCRCLLLLCLSLAVGFAPAPLPRVDRKPKVSNEMLGLWERPGTKLEITPDRFTHSADYDYSLTINPNVMPKTYDIRGIGRSNVGWTFTGIYKVEGNSLILSYNNGTTRPTAFNGQGQGGINEVYKRVR
jgi:uncharacterized protein (TIGR03067 family)